MARLENEFRDSLLMPVNGNSNEKDYRHEIIPGGYETYNRESKANAGRRLNREGAPTDFKLAKKIYSKRAHNKFLEKVLKNTASNVRSNDRNPVLLGFNSTIGAT